MQVDNNLETLRRALQDNREVFVSVVNKTNEDQETKHNNLVEDLEKVIDEVFKVRVKSEQGEQKIIQDTTRMQKMINDLEAHINTSIIIFNMIVLIESPGRELQREHPFEVGH